MVCSLRLVVSTLVAVLAVLGAVVWASLPRIVGHLVARASTHGTKGNVALERLQIGHAMAGGELKPEAASEAMADAIKAMAVAKVMGPSHTQSRGAWGDLVGVLGAAERQYLSPLMGMGLGPKGDCRRVMFDV